jgi:hypothetical protein
MATPSSSDGWVSMERQRVDDRPATAVPNMRGSAAKSAVKRWTASVLMMAKDITTGSKERTGIVLMEAIIAGGDHRHVSPL